MLLPLQDLARLLPLNLRRAVRADFAEKPAERLRILWSGERGELLRQLDCFRLELFDGSLRVVYVFQQRGILGGQLLDTDPLRSGQDQCGGLLQLKILPQLAQLGDGLPLEDPQIHLHNRPVGLRILVAMHVLLHREEAFAVGQHGLVHLDLREGFFPLPDFLDDRFAAGLGNAQLAQRRFAAKVEVLRQQRRVTQTLPLGRHVEVLGDCRQGGMETLQAIPLPPLLVALHLELLFAPQRIPQRVVVPLPFQRPQLMVANLFPRLAQVAQQAIDGWLLSLRSEQFPSFPFQLAVEFAQVSDSRTGKQQPPQLPFAPNDLLAARDQGGMVDAEAAEEQVLASVSQAPAQQSFIDFGVIISVAQTLVRSLAARETKLFRLISADRGTDAQPGVRVPEVIAQTRRKAEQQVTYGAQRGTLAGLIRPVDQVETELPARQVQSQTRKGAHRRQPQLVNLQARSPCMRWTSNWVASSSN